MSRGLLHPFRHRGEWIVYDASANDLVRVDPVVFALASGDRESLARFPPTDIERAEREWADARRDGLLSDHRPARLHACADCMTSAAAPIEHLTVTLTDRCNLRCRYCAYTHGGVAGVRRHGDRTLAPETLARVVRAFLDDASRVAHPVLSLYGGEPLLARELLVLALELVRDEAPRAGVGVVVDTNGLLLEDADLRRLFREHRVDLQVSLDGPAAIHDRHRRTVDDGPSHGRILAGLRALLREDPTAAARLRFQVTVVDPRDLPAVAAWFSDFPPFRTLGLASMPQVGVSMADLTGVPHLRSDTAPGEAAAAWQEARRRYVEHRADPDAPPDPVLRALFDPEIIRWYHRDRRPLGDSVVPGGFCRAGVRRRHLTVDGGWQPCERVGEGHRLGSVAEGFDVEAANELPRRFAASMALRCLSCWALRLCSVCAAFTAGREAGDVPEEVCDAIRSQSEATLRLWLDLLHEGEAATGFPRSTSIG